MIETNQERLSVHVVTKCGSRDEFVAQFRAFFDVTTFFLPCRPTLAAGDAIRFSIGLEGGGVMFEGAGEVVDVRHDQTGPRGRSGMRVRMSELDEASAELREKILQARGLSPYGSSIRVTKKAAPTDGFGGPDAGGGLGSPTVPKTLVVEADFGAPATDAGPAPKYAKTLYGVPAAAAPVSLPPPASVARTQATAAPSGASAMGPGATPPGELDPDISIDLPLPAPGRAFAPPGAAASPPALPPALPLPATPAPAPVAATAATPTPLIEIDDPLAPLPTPAVAPPAQPAPSAADMTGATTMRNLAPPEFLAAARRAARGSASTAGPLDDLEEDIAGFRGGALAFAPRLKALAGTRPALLAMGALAGLLVGRAVWKAAPAPLPDTAAARPAPVVAPPPVPAPPPQVQFRPCTAKVTSEPDRATVTVEGRLLGVTPIKDAWIPCGQSRLVVSKPPHLDSLHRIDGSFAEAVTVHAVLDAPSAVLKVLSRPRGAMVKVGGAPMGTTPRNVEVKLLDRVTVEVEKPGYRPWQRDVTIGKGKVAVTAKLSRMGARGRKRTARR